MARSKNNILGICMIQLYQDQLALKSDVTNALTICDDVCMVLPTGGGKTAIFSSIIADWPSPTIAIAHRQEIVGQMSVALARNGIYHKVIAPNNVVKACRQLHLYELGKNFVEPNAKTIVAGVDTLIRIPPAAWMSKIGLVVNDEAHHLTRENKWGRARSLFTQAKGLGVTATPLRADGKGLGRHADGFFDIIVEGLTMRQLINRGRLTEYRIFAPKSDINLANLPISAGGDFSPKPLANAVHDSHIVGDIVSHYLSIANGKRGITFCVNVEEATKTAQAYRDAGVPAEVVSAKTPDDLRASLLRKLKTGEVLQLVNVDLFGEGMDCPAVEVVTMARPTQSYGLFAQQFGRALRVFEGKDQAIIIDHVGNTMRHGLPDAPRQWSLDKRESRSKSSPAQILLKICQQCTSPREAYLKLCPYCGWENMPAERSAPEFVDGDLFELSEDILLRMRGAIDSPPTFPMGATPEIVGSIKKKHREKQEVQLELRSAIAQWAGQYSTATDHASVAELQRRFYHTFGVDVGTAQTLNRRDAEELLRRIK